MKQLAITVRNFRVGSVFGLPIDEALEQAIFEHKDGTGQSQHENVRAIYEEILRVQPNHADAMHLLGALYLQSMPEQMAVAASLVKRATVLMPNNPNYINTLGQIYEHLGDMDSAMKTYTESLKLDPYFLTPYLNLVTMYHRSGEYAKSEAFVRNIVENQTLLYVNREVHGTQRLVLMHCESLRFQGKYRNAKSCYNDALEIWPESGEIWNLLGNRSARNA